jgi:hypothetical protein
MMGKKSIRTRKTGRLLENTNMMYGAKREYDGWMRQKDG